MSGRLDPCLSSGEIPRVLRQYRRRMTLEERVARLENVVVRLSNIMELRLGPNAGNIKDQRVISEGELFHRWPESVTEKGAGA